MAFLSSYLENKIMALVFNGTAYTAPSTYLALFTSDPTETGSGTEVSGTGYARVQVNTDLATSPYWSAAAGGAVTNVGAITFPEAGGSWGTVTHAAVYDAVSGGNLLAHGSLTSSKSITSGATCEFANGELDMTLD